MSSSNYLLRNSKITVFAGLVGQYAPDISCSLYPDVYFGEGMLSHAQFFIQVLSNSCPPADTRVILLTRAKSLSPPWKCNF